MISSESVVPLKTFCSHQDLEEGRRVLDIQKQGLDVLASGLDEKFVHALDVMISAQGRVVLTGVGKSGHIAKKIASTLASTGTPSFFIHPAEASHGDLGMLSEGDVLLSLSNSGETKELAEIITFSKANHIPVIGITQNPKSTLAMTADIVLLLPMVPEACPLQLAPTTSSLVSLALGDALAMALLKRRGFTPQDFSRLHPGGKLGARLITVGKVMHQNEEVPMIVEGACMTEALLMMTSKTFGCVGVINTSGYLKGIITDGDLRRHMSPTLLESIVDDIMTPSPFTLTPSILAQEALTLMNEKGITGSFVLNEEQKVCGFLHMHDCIKAGVVL